MWHWLWNSVGLPKFKHNLFTTHREDKHRSQKNRFFIQICKICLNSTKEFFRKVINLFSITFGWYIHCDWSISWATLHYMAC